MSPAARRTHLLGLAVGYATEGGHRPDEWLSPVRMVTLDDVAVSLGKGRTSLYRLWPGRDLFWRDLAVRIASTTEPGQELFVGEPDDEPTSVLRRALLDERNAGRSAAVRTALSGYVAPPLLVSARQLRNAHTEHAVARWVRSWMTANERAPRTGLRFSEAVDAVHLLLRGAWTASCIVEAADRSAQLELVAEAVGELLTALSLPGRRGIDGPDTDGYRRQVVNLRTKLPELSSPKRSTLEAAAALLGSMTLDPDELPWMATLTIARLARLAGLSRFTVYRMWPNDMELRRETAAALVGRQIEQPLPSFASRPSSGDPAVAAAAHARVKFELASRNEFVLAMTLAADPGRAEFEALQRPLRAAIASAASDMTARRAEAGLAWWYGVRELGTVAEGSSRQRLLFAAALVVAALGLGVPPVAEAIDVDRLRDHLTR